MALHPACHAVENYLAGWFPEGVIREFEWTARRAWVFEVSVPTLKLQLVVSTDFLDKTSDGDIGRLLHEWYVASRMRIVGTKRWVYLSHDGVSVGEPEFPRRATSSTFGWGGTRRIHALTAS